MKKDQVKTGGTYMAKVTDRIVPVRLDRENPRGGWDATNLATNKQVRIKSAQRLRGPAKRQDAANDGPQADKPQAASKPTKAEPQRDTGEPAATVAKTGAQPGKAMSLLDAAALVLAETGQAMRCKDIVDQAASRGLWTPRDGKTPANTLHAAMAREIKVKGDESRFAKAERGHFAAHGG